MGNAAQGWLKRYDAMSFDAASAVIGSYSTSFSAATKLLDARMRTDIRNLYAMVRIADEIVDGTAGEARCDAAELLSAYEAAVLAAPETRFHTDPVLHAYAVTARRCNFDPAHITAFFNSMRRDTTQKVYGPADFKDYIYGSAEVIGLLCVAVFTAGTTVPTREREDMETGARALGAAFQKVNFLRDYGEDAHKLGRVYFPQLREGELDDAAKADIVADIRADLAVARTSMHLLPRRPRAAVMAAANLFGELTELVDATPAAALATTRVRVPNHRKLTLSAQAVVYAAKER